MKIISLILTTLSFLFAHQLWAATEKNPLDSSNLPKTIVYGDKNGAYTQESIKIIQALQMQLDAAITAADISAQLFDNENNTEESGANKGLAFPWFPPFPIGPFTPIDLRSHCRLIVDTFHDNYGNLLPVAEASEAAIDCGCAMIEVGYEPFYSLYVSHSVKRNYDLVRHEDRICPVNY